MNISDFQEVNAARAKRWHNDGKTNWTLLEWCGAMCSEAGEAANVAKKIRRLHMELPNKEVGLDIHDYAVLRDKLACEVADTIIYGLIILSELKYDASYLLISVFDQKSEEYGFPERAPK